MRIITKTVWILSLVSLFTDMASEMLYPVMPLFLKQIGYSAIFIGVLEGVAEAVAGLTQKLFWQTKRYYAANDCHLFNWVMALVPSVNPCWPFSFIPGGYFFPEQLTGLGKGIRTGARDAMLSDECNPETKGRVFGFHRSHGYTGCCFWACHCIDLSIF